MKMKKQVCICLMCLILLSGAGILSAPAQAADASGVCGDNLTWTLDSDGTLTISGYGAMTDWASNSDTPWYEFLDKLSSLRIESGVTSVGSYGFQMSPIRSVSIPDSVTTIGDYAFDYSGLTSVTIPDSVTTLKKGAFGWSERLTSVTIGEGVISIGDRVFDTCFSMENITIPASVRHIGESAFSSCPSLRNVYYTGTAEEWDAIDIEWDNSALTSAERHYIIAERPIVASGECGDNLTWTLDERGLLTISGAGTMTSSPWRNDSLSVKSVRIQDGVTNICNEAFRSCAHLTKVMMSESVASIGEHAFDGCSSIASVTIPDGVASIGAYAFSGCQGLTAVTIGKGVADIGNYAFERCLNLKGVTIPDGVASIGNGAFSSCENMTSAIIGENVASIGDNAFADCKALVSVVIPKKVNAIGAGAFSRCPNLKRVYYIGAAEQWKTVTIKGDNAPLTSAAIHYSDVPIVAGGECGENLTWTLDNGGVLTVSGSGRMGRYSDDYSGNPHQERPWQEYCDSITSVVIGQGVENIGSGAFYDCANLQSATLSNSVTSIADYGFENCGKLNNIVIPNSVTYIGAFAFYGCNSLTDVNYLGTKEEWAVMASDPFKIAREEHCNEPLLNATIHCTNGLGSDQSGVCGAEGDGSNVKWTLEGSVMTISGTGAMKDFDTYWDLPWRDLAPHIKTIAVLSGVTRIGNNAFEESGALTNVTIGDGVASIGMNAFVYCYNLTSVTIPNSVATIENSAFRNCDKLKDVYYVGTAEQWNAVTIGEDNEKLTSATFHYAHVVTFDPNGGVTSMKSKPVAPGLTYGVLPTPTRAGYAFDGWFTTASGGERITAETVANLTAPQTLYAHWTAAPGGTVGGSTFTPPSYRIFLPANSMGGKIESSADVVNRGSMVTLSVTPDANYKLNSLTVKDARNGQVTLNDNGNGQFTFSMPDSDVTVAAAFLEDNGGDKTSWENPFTDVAQETYYYDAVRWAVENNITNGRTPTTFGPGVSCTRAHAVTFLWRAAGSPAPTSSQNPFSDVSPSSYYCNAVLWAVENGITNGRTAATFDPNSGCNRGQIVTFLYRYANKTAKVDSRNFTDVSQNSYYYDAVNWAAEAGVTLGTTATTFSPTRTCNRGQIVTFLYRYVNLESE